MKQWIITTSHKGLHLEMLSIVSEQMKLSIEKQTIIWHLSTKTKNWNKNSLLSSTNNAVKSIRTEFDLYRY